MKKLPLYLSLCITIIVSGCLSPQSKSNQNEVPNEAQIDTVQTAIDQYWEKTDHLVPIKNKSSDTPIFEKYLVDFQALKDENLLSELPSNAYETGGYYQYTLVNPEDDPTVKLIDLRITHTIQEIYRKLDSYRSKHTYLPLGDSIGEQFFTIDFEKLGYDKDPSVVSPFSHERLPIIIDTTGHLYVDYRIDLYDALQNNTHSYVEGDDIRYLLVDESPFVPVYSPVYTLLDDEPVFDENE